MFSFGFVAFTILVLIVAGLLCVGHVSDFVCVCFWMVLWWDFGVFGVLPSVELLYYAASVVILCLLCCLCLLFDLWGVLGCFVWLRALI